MTSVLSSRKLCNFLVLLFAISLIPGLALSQNTGNISGIITDESGAMVVNTSVAAFNELTGFSRNTVSGSDGSYLLTLLPVGTYRVEAEQTSFKKFVRKGIVLTVGQNAKVDITLSLGEVTETISITGEAPLVDTRDASIATLMDERRLVELPLNGRSAASLIALVPGVTNVIPGARPTSQNVIVNIAGGRQGQNSFQMDGAQWNQIQYNEGNPLPPPDMLQEFRVETNSYDASTGLTSAGTFAVATKSGTNNFHGSLWEFLRNDDLNARNFFSPTKPFLSQNQFGFALGGPVIKNRTFFFGSYQGTRIRETVLSNTAIPPTEAEKRGDFSSSRGGLPRDPLTGLPFPGGFIPADRRDPAAVQVLNGLVGPNTADGRFVILRSRKEDGDQYLIKIDHQVTNKNRVSGRYWHSDGDRISPAGDIPWAFEVRGVRFKSLNITDTHTFTPNLINQFYLSRGTMLVENTATDALFQSSSALGIQIPAPKVTPFPPTVTVTGRFNGSGPLQGLCLQCDEFWDMGDTLSWIKGKHNFKFGFQYTPTLFGPTNINFDNGIFQFSGEVTGNALADFMIGKPSFFQFLRERENHSSKFFGGFIQDDFKVSRNITLNLGVRYHYEVPVTEKNGLSATFVPGFKSKVIPNAPAGMFFAGDDGLPKALFYSDKNNFAPRFGLAWDIFGDGKMSLRTGYGIFYQMQMNGNSQFISLNQPFLPVLVLTTVNSFSDPLKNFQGGVVPGDPVETYNPQTKQAVFNLPVALWAVEPNFRNPYVQQYSLSIQRQLPKDFSVEAAYVGSVGRKLQSQIERNPADIAPGATLANREQRRRYSPGVLAGIDRFENAAITSYNSMQASVTKRFSSSYLLNANYTWSRSLDETSERTGRNTYQNPDRRRDDYGLSLFHRAHVFSASWVWELPYFANLQGASKYLLHGWQITGLVRLTSGSPLTVVSGRDNSLTAINRDRADVSGDPVLSSDRPRGEQIAKFFNTAVFSANLPGQFGNSGRNVIIGPGSANTDLGLFKSFAVRENHQLQFRTEIFNLFNRPNFGNPNTTLVSPNFGRILAASDARIVQFALKYKF